MAVILLAGADARESGLRARGDDHVASGPGVDIAALLRAVGFDVGSDDAGATSSRTLTVYQTAYGFDDNTPPSATIDSHYYSVRGHTKAGGVGTYADPITFAAFDEAGFAPGVRIYVPRLKKYFIHEDSCGGCKNDWQRHHKLHVDLWVGADHKEPWGKLGHCEDALTTTAALILNPADNLPVDSAPLFDASTGRCITDGELEDESSTYVAPGTKFGLSDWTLQLPTYNSGHQIQIIKTSQLSSYASPYFYLDNGAMTLWAPEDGAHTEHSNYPRSELSGNTQWSVSSGNAGSHVMDATLRVDTKPSNGDIVVGQVHGLNIHSSCSCVLELGWRNGVVSASMRDNKCNDVKKTLATGLTLGKTWSYRVTFDGTTLNVSVNGGSSASLDYGWYPKPMHFKAGAYVQDSGSSASLGGRVAFTTLTTQHSG